MILGLSDTALVAWVGVLATVIPASVAGLSQWLTSNKKTEATYSIDLIENLQHEVERISHERDRVHEVVSELRQTVAELQINYARLQVNYARDVGMLQARLDAIQLGVSKVDVNLVPPWSDEEASSDDAGSSPDEPVGESST